MRALVLFSLSLFVVGCGLNKNAGTQAAKSCVATQTQITAYTQTVRVVTQQSCVDCHGSGQSPLFAQSDISASFAAAQPLMTGSPSTLETQAGNGHCGSGCTAATAASIKSAIQAYMAAAGNVICSASGAGTGTGSGTGTGTGTVDTDPATPSGLAAVAVSSSQVNLTWTDNSSDESGFAIQRSTDGTNYTDLTSVAANTVSFSDSGLNASTTYYYRVQAYNNANSSNYSNVAQATTPALTAPAAPSSLTATAAASTQINLTWIDNSNNESGFQIQNSTDGTNFSAVTSVAANTTTYSNTGLTASTKYYYRVLAYNTAGNSLYTSVANATTQAAAQTPPTIPNTLAATAASSSQINLTWVDASNNETGFRIESSTDGTTYTVLTTVAANTTTYSNTGLTASTKYYYKIQSYNAAGASAYTAAVNTTTQAAAAPPGQALYTSNCASCHSLGTFDTSGSPNLHGLSSEVTSKVEGGHHQNGMSATDIANLVAFIAMY